MTNERPDAVASPASPSPDAAPSNAAVPDSDVAAVVAVAGAPGSTGERAGAALRQAREAAGFELDALASLLKVPVPKLEALEAGRLNELPGLAFARALAQSVCRQLRVDPAPVLALLPRPPADSSQELENVTRGLATNFREPNTRRIPGVGWLPQEWPAWSRPSVLASALLLLLALAFWFWPSGRVLLGAVPGAVAVSEAASAAVGGLTPGAEAGEGAKGSPVVETVHSTPFDEPAAASGSQTAAAAGAVVLQTTAESWVEVRDAKGSVLLSRMLLRGEAVGLDGQPPLRLTIGNAEGTRLSFLNQPIDLVPYTRDNVARVELK
jgi:cytoskeleton protein RodZ